jgi:hypothetical protein
MGAARISLVRQTASKLPRTTRKACLFQNGRIKPKKEEREDWNWRPSKLQMKAAQSQPRPDGATNRHVFGEGFWKMQLQRADRSGEGGWHCIHESGKHDPRPWFMRSRQAVYPPIAVRRYVCTHFVQLCTILRRPPRLFVIPTTSCFVFVCLRTARLTAAGTHPLSWPQDIFRWRLFLWLSPTFLGSVCLCPACTVGYLPEEMPISSSATLLCPACQLTTWQLWVWSVRGVIRMVSYSTVQYGRG